MKKIKNKCQQYILHSKFLAVKSYFKRVKIQPPLKKSENISLLEKDNFHSF